MSDWDGCPMTGWDYHSFGASICMDFRHDTLVSPPGAKTRTVSPSLPLAGALTVKSPSCLSTGLLSWALLLFSLLRSPSVSQLSDQTWDTAERLISGSDEQPARKKNVRRVSINPAITVQWSQLKELPSRRMRGIETQAGRQGWKMDDFG